MPGGGRPRRNVTSKYTASVDQDEEEEEHVAADPREDEELEVEPLTSRGVRAPSGWHRTPSRRLFEMTSQEGAMTGDGDGGGVCGEDAEGDDDDDLGCGDEEIAGGSTSIALAKPFQRGPTRLPSHLPVTDECPVIRPTGK
jgi:hypothetical protein